MLGNDTENKEKESDPGFSPSPSPSFLPSFPPSLPSFLLATLIPCTSNRVILSLLVLEAQLKAGNAEKLVSLLSGHSLTLWEEEKRRVIANGISHLNSSFLAIKIVIWWVITSCILKRLITFKIKCCHLEQKHHTNKVCKWFINQ